MICFFFFLLVVYMPSNRLQQLSLSPDDSKQKQELLVGGGELKKYSSSGNSGAYPSLELVEEGEKQLRGSGVNRLKKATKWRDFAVDTLKDGVDVADKGLSVVAKSKMLGMGEKHEAKVAQAKAAVKKVIKRTKTKPKVEKVIENTKPKVEKAVEKVKKEKVKEPVTGAGDKPKRPPSKWILHVKEYAAKNNVSYKEALKEAKDTYKK